MQKYRADGGERQADNAVVWFSDWDHGRSLVKIENCRIESLAGEPRAMVYVTGEADTWFSRPAICRYMGKRVKGYVTNDDGMLVFRHGYYA